MAINLNDFMKNGIDRAMKTAGRFYLSNAKGRRFLAGIVPAMSKSAKRREQNEANGTHVPAFLIASTASQCNLRCAGCYARAGGGCGDGDTAPDLTAEEWAGIFDEALMLGVSFVLMAGGEPLMRRDVVEAAAGCRDMIFPVFTNGTMIDEEYFALFDSHRNVIPVLSIEGGSEETDERRGEGTYALIDAAMARFCEKKILYGVSVTVTKQNMHSVVSEAFVSLLRDKGCGVVFFVEYVPVEKGTEQLALERDDMKKLNAAADTLKKQFDDMVIMSFPGDEEAMGGCLASGRGFFHINAKGGAEPCPFSPYAKYNLKDVPMAEVLRSDYFARLREIAAAPEEHAGGCVLFEREKEVMEACSL